MPTPYSIGHGIEITKVSKENQGTEPKLAIVCGWMGAKPSQLKRYTSYYHAKGIDTLSFAVGPGHVLFPKTSLEHMKKVVNEAISLKPTDIIFHHFSVGGFLFGQMLRYLQQNSEQNEFIRKRVRAQVYDSPPDFNGIADGVSASIGLNNPVIRISVKTIMISYLTITSQSAGVEHRASSNAFHNNDIEAPALWFYSKADPVASFKDCETVIANWRGRGTHVEECVWDNTPHIQHGRVDPDRYFGTLDTFLTNVANIEGVDKMVEQQQDEEEEVLTTVSERENNSAVI